MELIFQEKLSNYPERILWDERELEETVDLIIPDSYPDAVNVINAFGTPLIYSVDLGQDQLTLNGEVQGGVIFEGSDGQIRSVRARVPFSLRRDLKFQEELMKPQCICRLISVDARVLNSRKLLLRATVSCGLNVFARREYRFYDLEDPAPILQLKRTQLPIRLPVSMGEKSFSMQEELVIPQGIPEAVHLLKTAYTPRILECKPVGDKAVFKGELRIEVLYECGDESLCAQDWIIPFSQYAALDQNCDESELTVSLCLSSADTQIDSQDGGRLLTSVELIAHCTAMDLCNIDLIEDAFCTEGEMTPDFITDELTAILDRQNFCQSVSLHGEWDVKSILWSHCYPTKTSRRREEEYVYIEQGVSCDVLYYDGENQLKGCTLRGQTELRIPLGMNAQCRVTEVQCEKALCAVGPDGIKVTLPLELWVESTVQQELCGIRSAEIVSETVETKRPALILRFTEEQSSVWEIAKSCRTSEKAIREANDLVEDSIPANTLLLIPL